MNKIEELIEDIKNNKQSFIQQSNESLQAIKDMYAENKELKEQQEEEWFFRWAARAVADGTYKGSIDVIFCHPNNPYYDNNPWLDTPPEKETNND